VVVLHHISSRYQLQNEVDTTYFGVQEGDQQDITDLVEIELKGRGMNKDPLNLRRRSTHFAGADEQMFAGFTYNSMNDGNANKLPPPSLTTILTSTHSRRMCRVLDFHQQ